MAKDSTAIDSTAMSFVMQLVLWDVDAFPFLSGQTCGDVAVSIFAIVAVTARRVCWTGMLWGKVKHLACT
jgi:hypothetical protein